MLSDSDLSTSMAIKFSEQITLAEAAVDINYCELCKNKHVSFTIYSMLGIMENTNPVHVQHVQVRHEQ